MGIQLLLDFLKSDSTALKHRHQDPHLVHILITHFAKRWCYLISLWSPDPSTHGLGLFVLSAWGGPSPSWDDKSFSTCWSFSNTTSRLLDPATSVKCQGCGLPLCGDQCQGGPWHRLLQRHTCFLFKSFWHSFRVGWIINIDVVHAQSQVWMPGFPRGRDEGRGS